jgi:glutamine synthetase
MAEELGKFADELEQSGHFHEDLNALIRRELTAHRRIIFDGNGYDEAWIEEAKRRGLCNNISTVDALPAYITEKNIGLFTSHAIYTRDEVFARYNIHVENYTATISMEARTMIDMLRKEILPAVSRYGTALCRGFERRKALGLPARYEETNARNNCMLCDCLSDACDKLEKDLRLIPADSEEAMRYCHTVIVPDMNECRSFADELETMTARDAWPIPVYSDLLFSEI